MNLCVKNLEQKLEECQEENEDLKSKIQTKELISKKIDDERRKILEQKEQQNITEIEKKTDKIAKLQEENAILNDKFSESEITRKKFKEKNTQLEKQLKVVLQEKEKIENEYLKMKKRVNDLSVLKTSNNKILEDKIKSLSLENDKLMNIYEQNIKQEFLKENILDKGYDPEDFQIFCEKELNNTSLDIDEINYIFQYK
ncbi:hypothetical protein IMG5_092170 [Ichthyophthirius multifiliis]|uniref:Uncharacterized protein n=1 Tax=Ichthyophthirius multifiliis TaxID=5932 RepID=G0QRE3_ICHMU|nr:hypothetical protein IMG5_092170 [Ichthyophthirius multifiliis]EGR32212.1 hypothetical protein IMG5_092170 [Ichthyophthirius multifiliis]|eukprot:XP_004035698.1 hypothetical protein IMG5_092170 [Ichthyophthirius multifiliis]